jgi:hypothetical protein
MSYSNTQHLPAGQVLTVTANASSSGSVQRLTQSGDSTQYPYQAVAASTSLVLGPYTNERQYLIWSDAGFLTSAISQPDQSGQLNIALMALDGAVAIAHRALVVFTKGSAIAATLAAPTAEQAGTVLNLVAGSAFAHVLTATALINDGVTGGAKTTCTFGAFVGASLHLVAYNLQWHVVSKNVCTIT